MKFLQLNANDERGARGLRGTYANETHYDHVVDDDTILLTPDGEAPAVLVTGVLSSHARRRAYKHLSTVDAMPSNRSTAVYRGSSLPRIRKRDGKLSRTRQVPHSVLDILDKRGVRTDILGYMDQSPRFPECRQSSWSLKNPEVLRGIGQFVREVDEVFQTWIRERYAAQLAVVHQAPGWHIHGTAFSSITVNRNFRTAYHTDRGDLKEGLAA